MALSEGNLGSTTVLKWNSVAVAEIVGEINVPEFSRVKVDSSNRDLGWEQSKPGKKAMGEFSITVNFLPGDAAQAAIIADMLSGTERTVTIEDTTAGWSWEGTGWVIKRSQVSPDDDANLQRAVITIQPTGEWTYSATASTGLTTPFFSVSESAVVVPAPAGSTYDYVATVLTGVSSVTVTPTASAGVIKVNGNTVTSGEASSAIALGAAGSITTVTITVQETGKTKKTYTIRVVRAAS